MGITAGSREVPGRNAYERRHTYRIIIIIYEECRRRNKNLSIAWIDYQKAFDSVPHSWVEKSIELVGVNSKIIRFCKLSMEKWNTRLILKTKREVMQSQPIQIR